MEITTELQFQEYLESLKKLLEAKELSSLEQLDKLKQLEQLKSLDNILVLEKILSEHKETLSPLENLTELKQLIHLEELSKLEKLSSLKILEKLDLLNDSKFHDSLSKLDQLDILKKGSRNIFIQQGLSTLFEIIKLVLVAGFLIFLISRESGQEIISKALPAIGLGQSAQVNLGLKLLIDNQSPDDFSLIINDVKSRIQNETDIVFSDSAFISLSKRLALLENLQNYSFKFEETDLKLDAKRAIEKRFSLFFSTTINKLEYESAISKSKDSMNLFNVLREVRLLLSQEKFPAAFERSFRYWNSSEALRNAAIIGATKTFQDDPKTLEEILKNLPTLKETDI